ncbi:MAG: 50S ribosomal protein L21 [Candidatus Latescibacterota bacterium]|nr:50S ribosomal protein L21 [Candidatus Latescibacterota bacterium]
MYAVIKVAGQQIRVEKGQTIRVPKLDAGAGDVQEFTDVLLVSDEENSHVGLPIVEGAVVSAKVLGHVRGEKVVVFKMRRRKTYRNRNGHRQDFTEIKIEDIILPN